MPNITKPFWAVLSTGRLFNSSLGVGGVTTVAAVANTLYATPIFTPLAATVTVIGLEITAFAAGNVRLGVYRDSNGVPGALLLDAGAVGTGTPNGFKSIGSLSQALTPGWYWLACVFDATPTVRALTASGSMHALGFTSGTDTTIHAGWSVAFTYAALPDPFTGGGALMTTNPPRVMIQT